MSNLGEYWQRLRAQLQRAAPSGAATAGANKPDTHVSQASQALRSLLEDRDIPASVRGELQEDFSQIESLLDKLAAGELHIAVFGRVSVGKSALGTVNAFPLTTIRYALERGATVILMSHLGRPKGKTNLEFTLKPVAEHLSTLPGKPVQFAADCIGPAAQAAIDKAGPGGVVACIRRKPARVRDLRGGVHALHGAQPGGDAGRSRPRAAAGGGPGAASRNAGPISCRTDGARPWTVPGEGRVLTC